jgi:hypothetical protein
MVRERAARAQQGRRSRSSASAARVLLATVLVAGAVVFAIEPTGAATTWTITPSPSPFRPARTALSAVSCATPTSCFAVGRRFDINEDEPGLVIERWNGSTWSTVVNRTNASSNPHLNGVSCAKPNSCVAVGGKSSVPIAKHWNGHQWKDIPPVKQGSISSLDAVDCPAVTSCWAVGRYRVGAKTRALIEHWNGTAWSVVAVPQLGAAVRTTLSGISCPSTKSCFAVGNHEEPGDQVGGVLVEHWAPRAAWRSATHRNAR